MLARGLVEPGRLGELFEAIEPGLVRFPSIDADALRARVAEVVGDAE